MTRCACVCTRELIYKSAFLVGMQSIHDSVLLSAQAFDVVMYGDTLIEAWRGTILGEPSPRVQGCTEIFHSHFGQKYSSVPFGIAGDHPFVTRS